MKTNELRSLIRTQILKEFSNDTSFLDKVGGSIRARLGTGKAMLDRALGMIEPEKLAKLPRQQKIDLLTALILQFGMDSSDFNAVKSRVQRALIMQDKQDSISEPYTEIKESSDAELEKALGLPVTDLGGATAVNWAADMLQAIAKLDDMKKAKALGWIMSQAGIEPDDMASLAGKIKAQVRKQTQATQTNEQKVTKR